MGEVHAVASMVGTKPGGGRERAKRIEAAMSQAVLDANAEGFAVGVHDAEIKERMMAARQRVLDED